MDICKNSLIFFSTLTSIFLINGNALADTDNSANAPINYASPIINPCNGIISITDRPSKADSACAVPYGQFALEGGYQFLDLTGSGSAQNFPQLEFRVGLPLNNELVILPPNYNTQTIFPRSGWGATVVGIKHEIGYTNNLVGAVEGLVTLPSGSNAFGSDQTGGVLNGIATYSFTPAISATVMLGVSTQTLPTLSNGQRFDSFNPDVLISYEINDHVETYAEVFGQTNAGPGLGYGYNADVGILYALTNNTEIDASFGQRITGNLGGYNNYFGVGFATLF